MQTNKVFILLLVLLNSLLGCTHRKVIQNDGNMPIEDIFNLRHYCPVKNGNWSLK